MSLAQVSVANAFGSPMVCRYNGFDFNNGSTVTTGFSVEPVEDEAGRTTIYNLYKLAFRTTFAGTDTTVIAVAARQALTKYGAPFEYSGRGLGDLSINTGVVRDVKFGPKPRELSFNVLGPGNAIELEWSIEVAVPDCPDARYRFFPLALSWTVTFDITDGYTTRTIAGYLDVPMTRIGPGNRGLADSVDAYRERLVPPPVEGFRRRYGPWQINDAKTRLSFSIIDEEMGANIPPAGVIKANASHHGASSAAGLRQWQGVISGEYELDKKADATIAAAAFFALCRARIDHLAAALRRSGKDDPRSIIPIVFTFDEPELYGRRKAAFSLGYSWTGSVGTVLGDSGLWRPVPGSNWRAWQLVMNQAASHARGLAKLTFDVGDDKIIDLCVGNQVVNLVGNRGVPQADRPFQVNDYRAARQGVDGGGFAELIRSTFPPPSPQSSWISYQSELFIEVDNGTVMHRLLPAAALQAADDILGSVSDIAGEVWDAIKDPLPSTRPGGGNVLDNDIGNPFRPQRRVHGMPVLYLVGKAVRAGFPVPVPRLVYVNGVKPIPANRLDRGEGYSQGVKFAAGDTPVFTSRWKLRFVLPSLPSGTLPIPPNPILGAKP
jgi:hypothetical protein